VFELKKLYIFDRILSRSNRLQRYQCETRTPWPQPGRYFLWI